MTPTPEELDEAVGLARAWLGEGDANGSRHVATKLARAVLALAAENERLRAERDDARANARIIAHSYTHDSRPPQRAVDASLAYPAWPGRPAQTGNDGTKKEGP